MTELDMSLSFAPTITIAAREELASYDLGLQQLLFSRGIATKAAAEQFLNPDYDTQLHSPLLLHDIVKATTRIKSAMQAGEQIAIFSDFDCDGIPGAVVAHDYFTAIGYTQFQNYIPHRHYEGFGLSVSAVEKLATSGVTLIITIDCGTSDVAAVARARELGVDVIITDHHEPGATLPDALAIINPKLGSYPFRDLCGAAVMYKLVQALLMTSDTTLAPGHEKWWLDMVGIATIADMVSLVGENRVFAHYGLRVLRKSRRPGLQQLLRKAGMNQAYLTEEDIGFTIGPRINAASRMDAPEQAFTLLTTTDEGEAGSAVIHLEKLNNERKGSVAQMTKELHKRLADMTELPPVLVFGNPLWRPALAGLAANKLAEEHNRPVFIWGRDGNDCIKGSCRSGGGVSVVRLMAAATEVFHEHGGHHMSGGFSVRAEQIFTLSDRLNQAYLDLGGEAIIPQERIIDAPLALADVFGEVRRSLSKLAPFGTGNPKPLFAFTAVTPQTVASFGKGNEHLKLSFETTKGPLEAIAFFATEQSFATMPAVGTLVTLLAHIEESFFMGKRQTRLRIVDIL